MKIKGSSLSGQAKQLPNKSWKQPCKEFSSQGQEVEEQGKWPHQTCRCCGKPGHKKKKCWKKTNKCLRYGSPKHRIEKCPLDKEGERKPKVESQENH